jgi:hypothetical protein
MRCQCCNHNLSDFESTARRSDTNEFLDLCLSCLKDVGIDYIGRRDLDPTSDPEPDDLELEDNEY